MHQLRDVVTVAAHLARRMGGGAAELAAECADEHETEGRPQEAEFWRQVARAIAEFAAIATPANDPADDARIRASRLEDRVLVYVARAMEAERRAALADAVIREELTDLADEWRELARQTRLLVDELPRSASGESGFSPRDIRAIA